jgi:hypothetical protein
MAGLKVLSLPLKRFCLLVKIGSQLSQPTRHSEVNGLTRHGEQDRLSLRHTGLAPPDPNRADYVVILRLQSREPGRQRALCLSTMGA